MQTAMMIRRYLKTTCASMHVTRLTVLCVAVEALIDGGRLTVTGLGRAVRSMTTVKHAIKRMDRLLSNGQIQGEREQIQAALIHWILGRQRQPVLVVDWSDLTADRRWQLLHAALPVGGRALTLYEEVHPLKRLTNPQVHRAFLRTLHRLVPPGITPIVVTDAGFRAPWFREGVLSEADADRGSLPGPERCSLWCRVESESHHTGGAVCHPPPHSRAGTACVVARGSCHGDGGLSLAVSGQHHTMSIDSIHDHIRTSSDQARSGALHLS